MAVLKHVVFDGLGKVRIYSLAAVALIMACALCVITVIVGVSSDRAVANENGHSTAMIVDAMLTDQHGKLVALEDFENKLVLMNFFFTGCEGVCPLQTAVLREVKDELEDDLDVVFLSVSIAPYSDTEESIHRYIEKYQLNQRDWRFVRTNADSLANLVEQFGVTVNGAVVQDDQLDHRNMGYLFGRSGQLMQQYQLLPGVTERVSREIVQLHQLQL